MLAAFRSPGAAASLATVRLNARYQPAFRLAEVIVRGESVEQRDGSGLVDGFLVNMVQAFEDFVATALAHALCPYGGQCGAPCPPLPRPGLGGTDEIRPDRVWRGRSPTRGR
ncbi:hypothetical protein ACFWA9_24755 [Kitasatospora sp. NPDC059973]|uniref:5-methylcytosine restriction system specificity protein McrC n=1 Tax=Kitasatospora sp. NPDC059973 TaxID=3347020 RepID=UPI0036C1ECF0